ncbi:MAG: hypothetical protein R3D59_10260 [Paracoccaceae bacterium]
MLDKPDVDYLLLLSSHEIAAGPEMIESVAKIMAKAGKSWTISTEGFEATNVGIHRQPRHRRQPGDADRQRGRKAAGQDGHQP